MWRNPLSACKYFHSQIEQVVRTSLEGVYEMERPQVAGYGLPEDRFKSKRVI